MNGTNPAGDLLCMDLRAVDICALCPVCAFLCNFG